MIQSFLRIFFRVCKGRFKPAGADGKRGRAQTQVALSFLLFLPCAAMASGFGWYVSAIRWGDFDKYFLEGSVVRARELTESPGTPDQVKQYIQEHLDEEVLSKYCNAQGRYGTDLSPFYAEIYPVSFLNYAQSLQKRRGVHHSLFSRFFTPRRPYIALTGTLKGDPYFVLTPEETEAAQAEVRAMNAEVAHPHEFIALARHLEGVLLMIANDRYAQTDSKLSGQMKSAAFFCGHD